MVRFRSANVTHAVVGACVLLAVASCTSHPHHHAPPTPSPTPSATATILHPTLGATSVRSTGARGDGTGDDTAAFLRAEDAALRSKVRFAGGPGGAPQAVVYVPPGSYRLLRLQFRSNVRLEVDAGAVLEQAGGRDVSTADSAPALIMWDGLPGHALKNVTVIGVNSANGGRKALANPLFPGWSVAGDFTFDLDPGFTNSSILVAGIQALNVDGFLIQNVFSIENDSQPSPATTDKNAKWPQTGKAALGLRERSDTPVNGSVFYDPHNGTIDNWYNVHAPKGYGPDQVNAGHNLTFKHIFSRGGTTMRFETDASQGKSFGSELRGVHADDVAGQSCNRVVSFAPHAQNNYDVHVSHVVAMGCSEAVIESYDESNNQQPGKFVNSTVTDITVVGTNQAQNSISGSGGRWQIGESEQAFAKDGATRKLWSITYLGTLHCTGSFAKPSDRIMLSNGLQKPKC